MITPEERKHLKKILGNNYVPSVREKLKKKGYYKSDGSEYSDSSIKGALNKGQNNFNIEECICEVYYEKKEQLENIKKMKKKLLSGKTTSTVETEKETTSTTNA